MNVQVGDWVRIIGTAKTLTGPVTSVNVGPDGDHEGPEGSVVVEDPGTDFFWVVPIEHVEIIESPAVTFAPLALPSWLDSRDGYGNPRRNLIPDEVDPYSGDYDPASMADSLLTKLGSGKHPEVWRNAPDVADVTFHPTADDEGASLGGLVVVALTNGVSLATDEICATDLIGGGDDSLDGGEAAVQALTAVAGVVNAAVARYHQVIGQGK